MFPAPSHQTVHEVFPHTAFQERPPKALRHNPYTRFWLTLSG